MCSYNTLRKGLTNMTFQPLYEGKQKALQDEEVQTRDWFVAICRRVTKLINETAIRDEITKLLDEISNLPKQVEPDKWGTCNGGFTVANSFRQYRSRLSSGYSWTREPESGYSDYYHQFEIGQCQRSQYSRQKLKIRKDGTVNEGNLQAALRDWASKRIMERRSRDCYEANTAEYEQLQSPGEHDDFVTVELSRGKAGMCTITYSSAWVKLGKMHDVPIKKAHHVISEMKATSITFASNMKEILQGV